MLAFRFTLFCCLLLLVGAPLVPAEEESPELKAVRESYEREIDFATRPIRDRYLSRLETLKRSLGARGDARGALAIQEEIDRVKTAVPGSGGVARFAGLWRVTYSNNTHTIFAINPDGSASQCSDQPKFPVTQNGKVTVVGKDVLLDFDDHYSMHRLNLSGDQLVIDLFTPRGAYPAGTPERITGVRIGERKP